MTYRVTAGSVTVETVINDSGSRAYIDIPRSSELPGDVPQEQVDRLLDLGHIAEDSQSELNKDELLELAESEGVEVDGRWSAQRIAKAIEENRE